MSLARPAFALAFAAIVLAACGGAVTPDTGPGSSSGGSSSGGSSSGGSSSGGTCRDGELSAYCPTSCGAPQRARCSRGAWICPVGGDCPPPPPPSCANQPPPLCACPANCTCGVACNPATNQWQCTSTCGADAGAPFDCGPQDCNAGDVCTDTPPGVPQPDGGSSQDYFQCVSTPKACASDYTCDCVLKAFRTGAGSCAAVSCEQTFGNIVVHCAGL